MYCSVTLVVFSSSGPSDDLFIKLTKNVISQPVKFDSLLNWISTSWRTRHVYLTLVLLTVFAVVVIMWCGVGLLGFLLLIGPLFSRTSTSETITFALELIVMTLKIISSMFANLSHHIKNFDYITVGWLKGLENKLVFPWTTILSLIRGFGCQI